MRKFACLGAAAAVLALAPLLLSRTAPAAETPSDWTFPATYVHADGSKQNATYHPIAVSDIKKSYRLCVLFPHMKDSYWLAADYGIVAETRRDHAQMHLFQAGGYTNLATQLNQMDRCIAEHYDAIILGAISAKGVASDVNKAVDQGIPVIDFVNGVDDPKVSAHALVSFYDLAVTTAKYLVDQAKGQKVEVGFFPGPEGAGWSDDAVRGFNDAITATSNHPGGVNVCFADGSVRFIKDSVNVQTWWALGSRNQNEVVSSDSY